VWVEWLAALVMGGAVVAGLLAESWRRWVAAGVFAAGAAVSWPTPRTAWALVALVVVVSVARVRWQDGDPGAVSA
jgi:hypothetical protein